jgi:hypothetical protein
MELLVDFGFQSPPLLGEGKKASFSTNLDIRNRKL